jgi:hypothetical protein
MEQQIYIIGNKEIQAYIPSKASRENLENLYDICNELFSDYADCFYTSSEVKKLKKNKENEFLNKKEN